MPLTEAATLIETMEAHTTSLEAQLADAVRSPVGAAGNVVLRGNRIFKPSGVAVIARGPEATIASASHAADVDAIAATGANAMRMLLTLNVKNGMTPAAFDAILARAAFHKMLVWVSLYVWDSDDDYAIAPALGGGNF